MPKRKRRQGVRIRGGGCKLQLYHAKAETSLCLSRIGCVGELQLYHAKAETFM